jgi:AcrR family transcriptional regulator
VTNDDDLTARARIRDAALRQFAELGYAGTTIRGVAAAAGVSLGLVRHHFGSKEALRDAVDAHVLAEIRQANDQVRADTDKGEYTTPTISRATVRPFYQRYLARSLMDGSPLIATMYDQIVEMTADWLKLSDEASTTPVHTDRRSRAAVLTAMVMGIPLLREHLSRALGVDPDSTEGDDQVALALLDLYSHTVISTELADAARKAMTAEQNTTPPDNADRSTR